jgi:hypothetical protein
MERIISVKIFPASLVKRDFYNFAIAFRIAKWKVRKPIVNIHAITSASTASTVAFASIRLAGTTTCTTHI